MEIFTTKIEGLFRLQPKVFADHRGFFLESYSLRTLSECGIETVFVQDNHSLSVKKGVLRGMHIQKQPHTQTKLVRVTAGSVFDVVVDLRKGSKTYGLWEGFVLSSTNFTQLYIPQGCGHGFCTLEDNTEFVYKNDRFYEPSSETGVRWNDPDLSIDWPVINPILSKKDEELPLLKEYVPF